jgi:hypothetical protein
MINNPVQNIKLFEILHGDKITDRKLFYDKATDEQVFLHKFYSLVNEQLLKSLVPN